MFKRIIFTGLLFGFTVLASAQYTGVVNDDSTDTPSEFKRNYDLLLSKKGIVTTDNGFSDQTVLFDDSVYIKRLHSLPTEMELVFNPAVKAQIELYAGKRKNQVSYMLGEGKYYFPIFEQVLDKEGLPLELKYLPVIESALNPVIRSRVGASGLWQFMAATGKMYDLEVNSLVDERFDPHKSTVAAVKYLKDLYAKYNDWNLVIAAYNCGPGRVDKAISRSGGQTDYWALYPYLPKETRGYVPIFIAATYIMNYFQEHNITPMNCPKPATMDSLIVNKTVHFQQISDVLNIPVDDIRKFNPQFKKDVIPGDYKGYTLNLPINNLTDFIKNEDAIYGYKKDELLPHRKVAGLDVVGGAPLGASTITYRVKRGDTLARIAGTYGVTSSQIKQWNGLSSNKLSVGRRLKIYRQQQELQTNVLADNNSALSSQSDTTVLSVSGLTRTVAVPKTTVSYYKVRRGDTWAGIAKKNKASIADIKSWNNIKSNKLIAGTSLKIQKTEYVEIQEAVKLPEPQLSVVLIDSTYTADVINNYVKNIVRDESSLPLVRISPTDGDEQQERNRMDDTKIIYHKVKIGETMTQIASRYNVSKKDIMSWNKLSSNIAKVGQRLLILLPDRQESGTSNMGDTGVKETGSKTPLTSTL
ncbi:LysM peptidoglycan-binding domain-containing protein [Dysgonomonas sp. BGC7]|uniref:LysM peptidoglycan-binding domain-containing protein n=1 Tax=Dysgonomonas sp. BGC7 TaxID=1658008 RepID=UPI000680D486|nr:LysM peptidoglycan-binding domain-containing protein [Dysgonomonas sp. BGC7]MBD8389702.1 LysM peptidoglycan-binding domain-containing protein [Dysgonomonas sp. BGC7]